MPGADFKQKKISLSVSLFTYEQLESLAKQKGIMMSDYIRRVLLQHLLDSGLPVCYEVDPEKEDAGQVP